MDTSKKITLKGLWHVLKQAGSGFVDNKITKLSASLAYYTIFSLGPLLMVIIYLANIFWRKEAIEGLLYEQIKEIVGSKAALQIQEIIKNAAVIGSNAFTAIIGFVTLIIGATSLFTEMQDSINMIWNLQVDSEKGWWVTLKNRLVSFSLVAGLAFMLLVSLIINGVVEGFMDKLEAFIPYGTVQLVYIGNLVITLLITTILFAIIFKVLPDAIIRWRDVAVGSLFTAVLFMLGRFGIAFYIGNSNPGSAYGTAGSLIILLLWIYYSAIILYFGAVFTKHYAVKYGCEIKPNDYAVTFQTIQVKSNKSTIQENENSANKNPSDGENETLGSTI
ncbi:YihY/virulence factor BrkB family protein [Mucilaginibacter sp. Bleaf8]|uniref:YihY/virulence factor BrkB family protein n=1 Tax=Mucilaginibacter sp. Bleaf8 TaxID=2834430 RepID=UPI001BCD3058|nr:YihY/virulence factor BrkB family protein [Mucilaginibacter sp. Bleaf8]MBS7563951.1 YihY/virulence factor BrkB family protein [Mucilaginibacter sp. Bleaf8]